MLRITVNVVVSVHDYKSVLSLGLLISHFIKIVFADIRCARLQWIIAGWCTVYDGVYAGDVRVSHGEGCVCPSARSHCCHFGPAFRRRVRLTAAQGTDGQSGLSRHSATVHRLADCLPPAAVWKICHRWTSGR